MFISFKSTFNIFQCHEHALASPTALLMTHVFSFLIRCSEEEKSDGLWNAPRMLNIKGLGRSVAECCEAERVLTKALLEMLGERSRHTNFACSTFFKYDFFDKLKIGQYNDVLLFDAFWIAFAKDPNCKMDLHFGHFGVHWNLVFNNRLPRMDGELLLSPKKMAHDGTRK